MSFFQDEALVVESLSENNGKKHFVCCNKKNSKAFQIYYIVPQHRKGIMLANQFF